MWHNYAHTQPIRAIAAKIVPSHAIANYHRIPFYASLNIINLAYDIYY